MLLCVLSVAAWLVWASPRGGGSRATDIDCQIVSARLECRGSAAEDRTVSYPTDDCRTPPSAPRDTVCRWSATSEVQ